MIIKITIGGITVEASETTQSTGKEFDSAWFKTCEDKAKELFEWKERMKIKIDSEPKTEKE